MAKDFTWSFPTSLIPGLPIEILLAVSTDNKQVLDEEILEELFISILCEAVLACKLYNYYLLPHDMTQHKHNFIFTDNMSHHENSKTTFSYVGATRALVSLRSTIFDHIRYLFPC